MSNAVDAYLERSTRWPDELRAIRPILLDAGLQEQLKWAKPCYGIDGKNIAILQEMKDFLALMFFKGALLSDPAGVLEDQGPNSRSAKRMTFTSVADIERAADTIASYAAEAIDVEEAGLTVEPAPEPALCPELAARLEADADLARAFSELTPGRRREYDLHISQAKKTETREARVDKATPRILAGKGLRDR